MFLSFSPFGCRIIFKEYFFDFTHYIYFFFYLGFLSWAFAIHRAAEKGGGQLFNSSLPLAPASRAFRHWPNGYCGELTSAHSYQPDLNWESSISERKSLTTKLHALEGSNETGWIKGFLKKRRDVSRTIATTKIELFVALVSRFQPLTYFT